MSLVPKLLFVFGTRPESIKLAPLILAAKDKKIQLQVCFTGQHMEMALPILKFFKIEPDHNLRIMKPGQSLNDISQALFEKFTSVVRTYQPTHIVVQGDTTSAAIASLIGFYEKVKIVHIEAGLRTYDMQSPWPEEFNRRLIALAADSHFAPTQKAVDTLIKEGISKDRIFNVGNTGIDALRIVTEANGTLLLEEKDQTEFRILVTLHRRESFGLEMISIIEALKLAIEANKNIQIIWPLHQNPQVKKALDAVFDEIPDQIRLTKPLGYLEFISQMQKTDLIVTDSGGIQEEAPFLGKPVLVCRNNTERVESIDCGAAILVGTSRDRILEKILILSKKQSGYQSMAQKRTPYGDGFSSHKILDILLNAQ